MDKKKIFIIIGSIIAAIIMIIVVAIIFNKKEPITYNVSFETNGGTKVSSQIVNDGELVQKPTDPTKDGYIFIEWILNGKIYDFSLPVNSNLVLTAKWEEQIKNIETFVVKFNSDGGTTISNQVIEKGNKILKPEDPVKEGYTFKGWTLNDEIYNFETIVEADLELKAKWEKEPVINTTTNNNNISNNNNTSNNNSSSGNNQFTENSKKEVKLTTPTITKVGFGVGPDGAGMDLKLEPVGEITGVEVYASTASNGTYEKVKTVLVDDLIDGEKVTVLLK
ncbi:MAG: InlB B-repeat-containing protein, partial [Bacilli bacterium]|nr:InlB B-repeat-containing protein [Bacilli bacterium]